jgi:hypothetical protein
MNNLTENYNERSTIETGTSFLKVITDAFFEIIKYLKFNQMKKIDEAVEEYSEHKDF